jgi:hypothetical protein
MNARSKARPRTSWALVLAILGGTIFGVSSGAAPRVELGRQGVQVRQLEMGYRLTDDSLRIRTHLVTGMAVEYRTTKAEEIDRILKFSDLLASGRAQLFVEIEATRSKRSTLQFPRRRGRCVTRVRPILDSLVEP